MVVSSYLEDNATKEEKDKGLDLADYLLAEPFRIYPMFHTDLIPDQTEFSQEPTELSSVVKKEPQTLQTVGELLEYAAQIRVLNQIKVNV